MKKREKIKESAIDVIWDWSEVREDKWGNWWREMNTVKKWVLQMWKMSNKDLTRN